MARGEACSEMSSVVMIVALVPCPHFIFSEIGRRDFLRNVMNRGQYIP